MMRIALYARKSRTTEKGESIANQIFLCKQYAALHFEDIHFEDLGFKDSEFDIYKDEGYSGGNMNRPAFGQLIDKLKSGTYDVLICYRLDRISRNVLDFSSTLELLTKNNVAFVSIKENFDTTSPMGRAMLHISSVFAQLERETIAERIRDNMLELAKTGRWLGGTPPIGYRSKKLHYESSPGKIKNYTVLEVDESKTAIVKLLFKAYLQLGSLCGLETYLIKKGIKTAHDKFYHPHVLRNILANPVYCPADQAIYKYFCDLGNCISNAKSDFIGKQGLMVYNKNRQGKTVYKNSVSDWIVAIGQHAPLVNSSTWLKVQKQLVANTNKCISHHSSSHALLTGLIYCDKCGALMKVTNQTLLKDNSKSYIYRCSNKLKSHGTLCDMPNAKGHFLDAAVMDKIHELFIDEDLLLKELISAYQNTLNDPTESERQNLYSEAQILNKERVITKLIRLIAETEDSFLEDCYKKEIQKLKEEVEALNEKLLRDKELTCVNFNRYDDETSINEKRTFLKTIIKYIKWDGKSANLYFYRNQENF